MFICERGTGAINLGDSLDLSLPSQTIRDIYDLAFSSVSKIWEARKHLSPPSFGILLTYENQA